MGAPLPRVEIPRSVGELAVPLEQVPDDRPLMRPEGCFMGLTGTDVGICEAGDPDEQVLAHVPTRWVVVNSAEYAFSAGCPPRCA